MITAQARRLVARGIPTRLEARDDDPYAGDLAVVEDWVPWPSEVDDDRSWIAEDQKARRRADV